MKHMSKRRARALAKRAEQEARAREASRLSDNWLDRKRAREAQLWYVEHDPLHAGQWPDEHDLAREMSPHGTHKADRPTGHDVTMLRAWDEDRVRWVNGFTRVIPRPVKGPAANWLAPAHETPARERRLDNRAGLNSGWCDAQEKAERAFARELRARED